MKERKKLIINAIISTAVGGFGLAAICILYFMYGSSLCAMTLKRHSDVYWFVLAFKLFFLVVLPAVFILLMLLGLNILFYFRKMNDA